MTRYEYRVTYRRAGWGDLTWDQSRVFQTRDAVNRFIAKLHGRGRPDLSPVTLIKVTRREVGSWTDVTW